MPPEDRFVCRFAAEPPQEGLPYGRWSETLRAEFLGAALRLDADVDFGEVGDPRFHPDRTWNGRTYVPVTAPTSTGLELFGFVSYVLDDEPGRFEASVDYTEETAEAHPEWRLDLNEEVVGTWRGEQGHRAEMTLVWGRPLTEGGAVVSAELAGLTVDQCPVLEDRFTLLAPDAYRADYLEIVLWDGRGAELARESLYEDDADEE